MPGIDWDYSTAKDTGLSFADRLERCPREPDPFVYAARLIAALMIRGTLKTFHKFKIIGREHLPRGRSFVLVANHASHLDTLALLSALPLRSLHRAYPLAARDFFCANKLRLAAAAIVANVMLMERDARGLCVLERCHQMLAERGNVLVIYPEGTRSVDGIIGLFRRGIGFLLAGTPHLVVPCYAAGTFKSWPKGDWIPHPARVQLVIGHARTYESVGKDETGVLHVCADLRREVLALGARIEPQKAPQISKEPVDDRLTFA